MLLTPSGSPGTGRSIRSGSTVRVCGGPRIGMLLPSTRRPCGCSCRTWLGRRHLLSCRGVCESHGTSTIGRDGGNVPLSDIIRFRGRYGLPCVLNAGYSWQYRPLFGRPVLLSSGNSFGRVHRQGDCSGSVNVRAVRSFLSRRGLLHTVTSRGRCGCWNESRNGRCGAISAYLYDVVPSTIRFLH